VTDTVYLLEDTVSVNSYGTYDSQSTFQARIDKYVTIMKFPKNE
jgi:hypothetical protein